MKAKTNGIVVIVYALFVLIGGMIGFAKAHSLPSLIMGTVSAFALLGAGVAMLRQMKSGYYLAGALSAILACFFAYRLILTQNFMPAGLMSLLSLIVLIALFIGGGPTKVSNKT